MENNYLPGTGGTNSYPIRQIRITAKNDYDHSLSNCRLRQHRSRSAVKFLVLTTLGGDGIFHGMARKLRVEYPGAIYPVR